MGILSSLKRRLNYVVVKPLLYHQEVAEAYSGISVVDGKLKGKTIVVTGATGGIGRAIVKRFLLEGCQVVIIGRDIEKLNHLKESFSNQEKSFHVSSSEIPSNWIFFSSMFYFILTNK